MENEHDTEEGSLSPNEISGILYDIAKTELSIALAYEVQRERFLFVVSVISGFIIASIGWDTKIDPQDSWQGIFLMLLGFSGVVQSLKFHSKKIHHFNRYRAFRDEIDVRYMDHLIGRLRAKGDDQFKKERGAFSLHWIKSQYVWSLIPFTSICIGLIIVLISLNINLLSFLSLKSFLSLWPF